jgi:diguanylate cyclase (GGDEF)-like protein
MQRHPPDQPRADALEDAVGTAALLGATRSRAHAQIAAPDRRSGLLTGGSFILVLGAWLLLAPPTQPSLVAFLACILAHAAASSVEFELGPGSALPTTPVLVLALFLLPPPLVPAVAASGLLLAAAVARLRDPSRRERLLVIVGSAWHAIGPAAVFAVAGIRAPSLADLPVYGLALATQFGCDAIASWVRNGYGLGVPTRLLVGALRFTFMADLLLAPIGLAAALADPGSPGALLFLVPPTLLLAVLQRDRERQISRTVVLGVAVTEATDRARRDALTGLANRLAWEEAVARQRASSSAVGVLFADIDGLKVTNDVHGHEAGDRLLIGFARVLERVVPAGPGVVVARLGGDEFGVLLPGDLAHDVERVATTLRVALAAAPPVEGRLQLSASLGTGVAVMGAGLGDAFADADRGVYTDKNRDGVIRRTRAATG